MTNQEVRGVFRQIRDLNLTGAALLLVLVMACHHSPKQEGLTYGGPGDDRGNAVQQTADGGYIIAGTTISFGAGDSDIYVIRTNAAGDTQWTRTFGGTRADMGNSVEQTVDGGYIIAGATLSFGVWNYDVYLIKIDDEGTTVWTRTYGGSNDDKGISVEQTQDSGFVIAGFTASYGAGNYDYYLIKTNPAGDTQWTRTFGGANSDQAYSVCQTSDGGYAVTGNTDSYGAGGSDVYLVRINAAGDSLWTRTYGGVGLDWSMSVEQTPDNGFVVAGATGSFGAGVLDVYLIKTGSSLFHVGKLKSSLPAIR